MPATLIDGRAHAQVLRQRVQAQVKQFNKDYEKSIELAVILVGENPASIIYVNNKIKACQEVGISSRVLHLPTSLQQRDLLTLIQELNDDVQVDGILLQLPISAHLNPYEALALINPIKDVDGLTPFNQGLLMQGRPQLLPCTPQGCLQLIHHYIPDVSGKEVVVIGRSILVGRPMAMMLTNHNATVTIAHSQTEQLEEICHRADILVVAIGKPQFINRSFIKLGALVIDVGINRLADGRLVGDVDFDDVVAKAGYLTPVPGGVGPMTIANLLFNTVKAAKMRKADKP
jgi:methylenetetrahydrofolate dehydrogenase (NADP+)/methenyltetrahydrofolate cyclohydrolase